jgi:hypothetical protein
MRADLSDNAILRYSCSAVLLDLVKQIDVLLVEIVCSLLPVHDFA